MATPSPVSPETLINVKVTHDGNTRRFKLALKEVGPSVFQEKIRELLALPPTQKVQFERYSDSAARFIVLDPENTAVYKQLFRAAKAKLKLRIRLTTVADDAPPENNDPADRISLPPSYSTTSLHQPPLPTAAPAVEPAHLDEVVARAVTSYCSSADFTSQLRDTVREEVEKVEKAETAEKQSLEMADLINLSRSSESLGTKPDVELLGQPLHQTHVNCSYAIYCNACNGTINGLHYHCETCDGGDYDLCVRCVEENTHCYDTSHLLTKRDIIGGKPLVQERNSKGVTKTRICNSCVGRFGDEQCVVCLDCEDFDLCLTCLRMGEHGHDPRHGFARAQPSAVLTSEEEALLPTGRATRHAALCDRCDRSITGIRHKCIDCPDWDYCSECITFAHELHPGHRFVPVLDSLSVAPRLAGVKHNGVYCDGPICGQYCVQYRRGCIQGPRYKCAICPDTDFCGTCEASPLNHHNISHPLIKFKSPIRNVHVTAIDKTNGVVTGDLPEPETKREININTATQVQTIADVKPTEEFATPVEKVEKAVEQAAGEVEKVVEVQVQTEPVKVNPVEFHATFSGDSIADGTNLPAGQDFTQTWYMKNTGTTSWPAGVSVKFLGGDYMFLKSDEKSLNATVTDSEVQPGETASFSVGLSATWPPNKSYTSYWRLTAPDGQRFGDNIWCSINVVESPVAPSEMATEHREEDENSDTYSSESVVDADSVKAMSLKAESLKEEKDDFESVAENMVRSQAPSEMVFPKLEVESPVQSLESLPSRASTAKAEDVLVPVSSVSSSSHKTFAVSENGDIEEEVDISSIEGSEGFMTDEEYDVLCASDEEFEDCERKM